MLQKQAHTEMDGFQMVPIWFFDFLSYDVWNNGISNLPCGQRSRKPAGSNQAVLDVPGSLGLDVFGKRFS